MHSSRVCTVTVDGADGYHKLMCRATGGAWACGATSTQPPRVRCKWGPVSGSPDTSTIEKGVLLGRPSQSARTEVLQAPRSSNSSGSSSAFRNALLISSLQLDAPASFRGYNAALMEQGQEGQWRDALARMHQGVQFLQLDRLVGPPASLYCSCPVPAQVALNTVHGAPADHICHYNIVANNVLVPDFISGLREGTGKW